MIKFSATVMKRVPIDGLDYSSRSCSAGIEAEMPSGASSDELQARLKQLYGLVELTVDEELSHPRSIPGRGRTTRSLSGNNGNGNGNGRSATQAQLKAIGAIARQHGLADSELGALIRQDYSADDAEQLSIRQASALIDILKGTGRDAIPALL